MARHRSVWVRGFDEDAICERDIVVATPKKFDFVLRNEPTHLRFLPPASGVTG
nr:hypothetical protein [uncultured Ruegeria sp.]